MLALEDGIFLEERIGRTVPGVRRCEKRMGLAKGSAALEDYLFSIDGDGDRLPNSFQQNDASRGPSAPKTPLSKMAPLEQRNARVYQGGTIVTWECVFARS